MSRSKVGPIVTAIIVIAAATFLFMNRETADPVKVPGAATRPTAKGQETGSKVLEHPIGDEVVRNHMEIAAVWLPSVGMAGMPEPPGDQIHIEADIKATAENPNGFSKDEFVPYLKIKYELSDPKSGKMLQSGDLTPMVASDGLHYGANILKPGPGTYRLGYKIDPPSSGGLGRHSDPATGVAPWWEPFEASFDWVMEPQ